MNSSTTRIRALIAGTALAAALALPASFAAAAPELMGSDLGKTTAEVTANLKSMGYDVRRFEDEDGMIEGYATKDGDRFEIYVDPATGKVAKFKKTN